MGIYPDPNSGWGDLAGGGLEVHEVPGYQGGIVSEPNVKVLAEKLVRCLEMASTGTGDDKE